MEPRDRLARRVVLLAIALAAAVPFVTASAGSVFAAKGVAMDLGRVRIIEPLAPGGAFDLPAFRVTNPGDEAATYAMSLAGLAGTSGIVPHSGWLHSEPASFVLQAGESRAVVARLVLPAEAAPGRYAGIVRAQLTSEDTGTLVGAAAGAHLEFEIIGALDRGMVESAGDGAGPDAGPGLMWPALLVSAALVAAWVLGRRYRISIGRR